jgi:acyl dehydratase
MGVTYDELMSLQRPASVVSYSDRETILYALSVGMGRSQVDERELPFVYEGAALKTIPSMATVLMAAPVNESGLDFRKMLHGEQRLRMFKPIPPAGKLVVDSGVGAVIDKGKEKGSVIDFVSSARTEAGEKVFETTTRILARGDGGIGGPTGESPKPAPVPDSAPDWILRESTRLDQALLYRLNNDRNPLHADPALARAAGFKAPILHGLCTFGIACKAVMLATCNLDPSKIGEFNVRFTAPVMPGDTLEVAIWQNGPAIAFKCRAVERDTIVLDNGTCTLVEI